MARGTSRAAAVLVALVLAVLPSTFVPDAAAQGGTKGFTIGDGQIANSAGLAADPARNVYWTANTSGPSGRAYALNTDGAVRGTFDFGAHPLDVEALAFAGGRLYVGDIGDTQANRDHITVFHFANPSPGATGGQYRSYDFSYPDGPKDAAAMLVDPQGRIFIVSKGKPGGIYAAPAQPSAAGVNRLTKVSDAPANVTDGTVLRDGRIALRTYQTVLVLNPSTWQVATRAELPHQPAGESITQSLDGSGLLVGSKGPRSVVDRVGIPTGRGDVPEGTKDAPGAAKPTEDPKAPEQPAQPTPEPVEDSGKSPGRNGTWVALGLALIASLIAAAIVGLRGRRNDLPDDGHEETAVLGRRARSGDTGEIPVVPVDAEAERPSGAGRAQSAQPGADQPAAEQSPGEARWRRPREASGNQAAAEAAPAPAAPARDAQAAQPESTQPESTRHESTRHEDGGEEPQRVRPRRAHDVRSGDVESAPAPAEPQRHRVRQEPEGAERAEGVDEGDAWSQVIAPDSASRSATRSDPTNSGSDLMPRPRRSQDPDPGN